MTPLKRLSKTCVTAAHKISNKKGTLVKQIDAKTAHDWISHNEAILIDVREPDEYARASIESARLEPLSQIQQCNIEHTNKKIILHCQAGVRSAQAYEVLINKFPDLDFYNMDGGIVAWHQENLPIKFGE